MSENTSIEWADHTFNPWEGCQKVGPGCDNCYAETRNARFAGGVAVNWGPSAPRRRTSESNWKLPLKWNKQAAAEGRRFRVFCASLADVFDNAVPGQWRIELMRLIVDTPHLDWLLLTKRIGNAAEMLETAFRAVHAGREGWADNVLPNVWIGATVVNQAEADRDIPKLMKVPAYTRFLSIEPMLGPIDLKLMQYEDCDYLDEIGRIVANTRRRCIHSVIVGGESGTNARPMSPDWARSLRDQCAAAGVPFLFKQWGEWLPMLGQIEGVTVRPEKVTTPDGWVMGWAGKKAAGRRLDGVTHDGFPALKSGGAA